MVGLGSAEFKQLKLRSLSSESYVHHSLSLEPNCICVTGSSPEAPSKVKGI